VTNFASYFDTHAPKDTDKGLRRFYLAYANTAFWSSAYGETGNKYFDDGEHEESEALCAEFLKDCIAFWEANSDAFYEDGACMASGDPIEQAGHDFWLTRNSHGAGFWDGDWSEPYASQLDKATKAFGGCDLYVGDDGLVYSS
jgi:hypothetical protein